MQSEELNQDGLDPNAMLERPVEPRTTAFEGLSCERCGVPLTGRKERFCSNRCRMRARRAVQATRRRDALRQIRDAVTVLEDELLGEVWGFSGKNLVTRAVDVAVRRLRMKVERDAAHPAHRHTWQLALSRNPTADELRDAEQVVRAHGLSTLCRVIFNTNEFLFLP